MNVEDKTQIPVITNINQLDNSMFGKTVTIHSSTGKYMGIEDNMVLIHTLPSPTHKEEPYFEEKRYPIKEDNSIKNNPQSTYLPIDQGSFDYPLNLCNSKGI